MMKQLLSFFLTFTCIYSLNAQTASVTNGCVPLTVNFTPPSGATSSYWDFKDGATSNLSNPSNTFVIAGTYLVEYKSSQNGAILGTIAITVAEKPIPLFTSDVTSGCVPLTVNFNDVSTVSPSVNITGYSWVFEDGGTASGQNTSHTFTSAGSFFVSLELNTSSPSCNVTKQFNNYITASDKPVVGFTTNPDPPVSCTSPLTVAFSNTSSSATGPLTYSWDLGNGQTSSNTNPPDQTYTVEQNYPVKLVAVDPNGCSDSIIKVVSVGSVTPVLQFKDTLCLDQRDTIYNFSSGAATWDLNQLNLETHGFYQGLHPIISFETGGTKMINLRLSAGGCFKDTTLTIFVYEITPDFVSTPDYSLCYPATINFTSTSTTEPNSTFEWFFDDTTRATGQTVSKDYINLADTNPYFIHRETYFRTSLAVTNSFGCRSLASKIDTVFAPTALMAPSVVRGCVPLQVTFSDSSMLSPRDNISQWEWVFGDGNSTTNLNDNDVTHTYNSTGEYWAYLVITTSTGCVDTSYSTKIRVGEPITPNFVADQLVVCIGDTVNFSDQTVSTISDSIDTWDFASEGDRLFSCADNNNPFWVYNDVVGFQDVTMTVGYNGCYTSFTRSNYIEVKGAVAEIDYLKYCGDQKFLVDFKDSSQNSNNTLWRFGDGSTDLTNHPSHTYASTGDYEVVLRAEDIGSGCAATFDTAQIYIRDVQANFQIDSLICAKTDVLFDASQSIDVHENCYRGYRWVTSDPLMRPYTTSSDSVLDQFFTTGSTTVQLFTTDINGCVDTASTVVRVYDITSNFGMNDYDVCPGQQLVYSDSSTSDTTITQWSWSFGDSNGSSNQNTTHSYDTLPPLNHPPTSIPRLFRTLKVNLYVRNAIGCSSSKEALITFYKPTSVVTVNDSSICSGSTVNFTATDFTEKGSNLSFNWDFKNTSTSTLQNPSSIYATEGNYLVNLEIEELATGCKNNIKQNIAVVDYPVAGFSTSADGQKYLCPGTDNILFTDTSISSVDPLEYLWNFGNGVTSRFQNPGTFYRNNGTYTITQTVNVPQPFGCSNTFTREVTVKGPSGNFVTDLGGDTICRGEFVNFRLIDTTDVETFFWSFGDGDSLKGVSPVSHQYNFVPNSGQTVAKLIMSNSDGSCEITRDTLVDIYEVKADFLRNNGLDTAICFAPYPLENLSRNADSWSWDFGNGTTSTNEVPGIINYATAGNYLVQLSVSNNRLGCTDTLVKKVILHPIPDIEIIGDTICEGDVASINIINPNASWKYSWETSPMVSISNDTNPSITSQPLSNTIFYASVVDTNLCTNKDTATIFVINPLGLTDFDTIIVVGDEIDLPVYVNAGLYEFTWTGTEGLSCLDCSPPRIQPFEKITYNLVLKDVIGCFSYDVNFVIDVHPETFVKLPTSFTPNNDRINDLIFVQGWGIKELIEYKIFNRWGEIVFETTNLEKGWDGTYKGEEQNSDVYVYKVRVLTWRNEEKALEGYINLIR